MCERSPINRAAPAAGPDVMLILPFFTLPPRICLLTGENAAIGRVRSRPSSTIGSSAAQAMRVTRDRRWRVTGSEQCVCRRDARESGDDFGPGTGTGADFERPARQLDAVMEVRDAGGANRAQTSDRPQFGDVAGQGEYVLQNGLIKLDRTFRIEALRRPPGYPTVLPMARPEQCLIARRRPWTCSPVRRISRGPFRE